MELTAKTARNYMQPYWPSGKRFTAELMIELVTALKARRYDYDDFVEAVKKYREHYQWTSDDKYKQSPGWGQLVRLHKPKWLVDNEKMNGAATYDEPRDEPKDVIPFHIHKKAMAELKTFNSIGCCDVFIEYYGRIGNDELKAKWENSKIEFERKLNE